MAEEELDVQNVHM